MKCRNKKYKGIPQIYISPPISTTSPKEVRDNRTRPLLPSLAVSFLMTQFEQHDKLRIFSEANKDTRTRSATRVGLDNKPG